MHIFRIDPELQIYLTLWYLRLNKSRPFKVNLSKNLPHMLLFSFQLLEVSFFQLLRLTIFAVILNSCSRCFWCLVSHSFCSPLNSTIAAGKHYTQFQTHLIMTGPTSSLHRQGCLSSSAYTFGTIFFSSVNFFIHLI